MVILLGDGPAVSEASGIPRTEIDKGLSDMTRVGAQPICEVQPRQSLLRILHAVVVVLFASTALSCAGAVEGGSSGARTSSLSDTEEAIGSYQVYNLATPFLIIEQAVDRGDGPCLNGFDGNANVIPDVGTVSSTPQDFVFRDCGSGTGRADGVASKDGDGLGNYDFDFNVTMSNSNYVIDLEGIGDFVFFQGVLSLNYQATIEGVVMDVDVTMSTIVDPFLINGTVEISGAGGGATCNLVNFRDTDEIDVVESACAFN